MIDAARRRRHLHTPAALGGGHHVGPQLPPDRNSVPPGAQASLFAATGSMILDGDLLWRFQHLPRPLQVRGQQVEEQVRHVGLCLGPQGVAPPPLACVQVSLATQAGANTPEQILLDLSAWTVAMTL